MIKELARHRELLQMEYNFERDTFRKETQTMGIGRKVKRGDCWFPITLGQGRYNSLNRFTVEVFRQQDEDISHNFEYGKPVCFFYQNGNGEVTYLATLGTVSYAEDERMVVTLPSQDALLSLQGKNWLGIQLYFDEQTYRLMFDALDAVINAKDNRIAELRDIFHTSAPLHKLTMNPVGFPWLNPTQEHAVNEILRAKDVAVVHGPPGTGKTTTLVEAIYEVLRRESQVMVCAQSNMAVDWISEQLADRGLNVLRIGNPSRVNDKMLSYTYEKQFESHPDYPELWAIRRSIRQLYNTAREKRGASFHQKINRLKDKANEIELRIRQHLFEQNRVIACTLAGAGNPLLTGEHYHTVFIDEAAQALEAACWIAIRKADRVILAGDHCQLPPTIKCYDAEKQGLAKTLMETIVSNKPQAVSLLQIQYRMSETLMHFSSEWFYEGKVKSAPTVKYQTILELEKPLEWIDTSSIENAEEKFIGDTYGRINEAEATLTVHILQELIGKITPRRLLDERISIGIISPYKAQVQKLRCMVKNHKDIKPFRNLISINTVDGFQGQERDIIIISLVRSNQEGKIGFLSDLRRMNVAMTRARMKLIILGNSATLSHHTFYKKLYEHIIRRTSSPGDTPLP